LAFTPGSAGVCRAGSPPLGLLLTLGGAGMIGGGGWIIGLTSFPGAPGWDLILMLTFSRSTRLWVKKRAQIATIGMTVRQTIRTSASRVKRK